MGSMRIGGGIWKGRRLAPAPGDVRPTTAQSREILFNWLGDRVRARRCLDLFAGAGSLSLEAISRGAAAATMLEFNGRRCRALRQQSDVLLTSSPDTDLRDRLKIQRCDSLRWLRRTLKEIRLNSASPTEGPNLASPTEGWDLIFVDPPYGYAQLADCLQLTTEIALASALSDCLLYLETDARTQQGAPEPWVLEKQRRFSDHWLRLYRLGAPCS